MRHAYMRSEGVVYHALVITNDSGGIVSEPQWAPLADSQVPTSVLDALGLEGRGRDISIRTTDGEIATNDTMAGPSGTIVSDEAPITQMVTGWWARMSAGRKSLIKGIVTIGVLAAAAYGIYVYFFKGK